FRGKRHFGGILRTRNGTF
ncbi:unnamed protein product, partial [Cylindrotheca closterium]